MIVHASLSGHYDWVPCPPGTQITEDDARALKAKQMADGAWHMRVEAARDTWNDVSVPEAAICDRMAALEKLGRPQTREATVAELVANAYRHHLNPAKHLTKLTVHDEGPHRELYAAALAQYGVTGPSADVAIEAYLSDPRVEAYLQVHFKVRSSK